MTQITSLLRVAASRRALLAAAAPAPITPAPAAQMPPSALALEAQRPPYDSQSFPTPPARASADFTARVMARVTAQPPEPDPRELRAQLARARLRRLARVYVTLLVVSGVALLALALLAPWLLVGGVAAIVSLLLLAVTFATLISAVTGGLISGFGVAWLAMLAALTVPLLVLARRAGRRTPSSTRPHRL